MELETVGLKPHPRSVAIYGKEQLPPDFLESIRTQGILVPLVVKSDGTIISGHRRWQAARLLGMERVPAMVAEYPDELSERRAILDFNRQRDKTFSQRMREAEELKAIESAEAHKRQAHGQTAPGRTLPETLREASSETSRHQRETSHRVGEAVGLGSGRTYDKAEKVWEAAQEGNPVACELVEKLDSGQTTVHAAHTTLAQKEQRDRDFQPAFFPAGRYAVIYADPPWSYRNTGFHQSAESHYPTMTTEEIAVLPVADWSTPNSVLFLWATSPLLPEALAVLAAWGFTYKASMVWDKGKAPGMGWFVQTQHEFLLIGTREANPHPAVKPVSVIRADPGRHSAKPEQVYALIESMYPGPYLELFAREKHDGWQAWGNEIQ